MQITHAEAHRLIQFDLDHVLNPEKERSLFAHLEECDDCRAYARGMRDVENKLRQVMNKKWNRHGPLPFSINSIKTQGSRTRTPQNLFQFRTALISMVLVAFSFIIWQITATPFDPSASSHPFDFDYNEPCLANLCMDVAQSENVGYAGEYRDSIFGFEA